MRGAGYHPPAVLRFPLFAFLSLLLLMAAFNLGVELMGGSPELGPLVGWHDGGEGLPGAWVLASWALEALALTALFTLIAKPGQGRVGCIGGLLEGLLTAWIAWVFRGPLLVLAAVGYGDQPGAPWWRLSLRWFALYTLAGLVLALVARWGVPPTAPGTSPAATTAIPPPTDTANAPHRTHQERTP